VKARSAGRHRKRGVILLIHGQIRIGHAIDRESRRVTIAGRGGRYGDAVDTSHY
jgi:hypothetical protein